MKNRIQEILRTKGTQIYDIDPEDTVYSAIEKMADKNIGALLVMRDGSLKGIISERDYRNKVILKGRTSKNTKVRDIMTSEVYCITPKESIEECMALMTNKKFRHLPVKEDDQVVGVVSIGDLVKAIISRQKVEIDHLRSYIDGSYPG